MRLSSLSSGSTFPLHGCTTKLRLSSQSSGNTFTQNPQPKTTKRDLNSRYLNSLLRNVRLKRFYGTEQGDHSCKQAYTEQEVPPKPALQNQGTPNNKNCFAGRVFFLLGRGGGGGRRLLLGGRDYGPCGCLFSGLVSTGNHKENHHWVPRGSGVGPHLPTNLYSIQFLPTWHPTSSLKRNFLFRPCQKCYANGWGT